MAICPSLQVSVDNSTLFKQKIATLFAVTVALIPLIRYKNQVPAEVFISSMIGLHVAILVLYLWRTNWKAIKASPSSLVTRMTGCAFFIFLLTLVKFEGSFFFLMLSLAAAFVLHVAILLSLMGTVRLRAAA